MITFDKLILKSTLDSITIFDPAKFMSRFKDDVQVSMKFKMKQPFLLGIDVNFEKDELIIEFTGKILGEKYPELISLNTIRGCFQRINALGFCEIDTEKMMSAEVMLCDVTKDVSIPDVPSLNKFIQGHIRNYQSYVCDWRQGNLIISKGVKNNRYQRRLTIYDKQKEMNMKQGQRYMDNYGIEGKYDGICRFELNLVSQEAIRNALEISGTTLLEVLQAEHNPIEGFLNNVIQDDTDANTQATWKTYWQTLVLEDCGYDLARVEAKLREFKGGGIAKAMRPFRELMEAHSAGSSTWSKKKLLDVVR